MVLYHRRSIESLDEREAPVAQPWDPFDVPYDVHTNRELEFMLERGKPLAHFSDVYPSPPDEWIIPEEAFAPYVLDGTFEKREFVELLPSPVCSESPQMRGTRHVLYARRAEAWRIEACLLLIITAGKAGWSEGFERLEGSLLGYEEWQNDAHVEHIRSAPHAKSFYWLRVPE